MSFLRKLLVISLFLLISIPSFAQNKFLIGQVLDTLNQPIPYANVIAINQTTQKIGGFGISDVSGRFKISLTPDAEYLLRVSFVGFTQFERVIKEWSANDQIQIVLSQDETMLDLVEVVTELPITMKGDTLTYKTDAFTTGTERKLGDVLEKLPGFEVDDNGEVKVQGRRVDKVMVDGKPFFDGDTKLATKNLPANAIDRVQVLKNFSEVAPTRGLDNNETLALNIQLKEGKKNLVFGDLTAGVGLQERYLGHANAFYYAPKLNVNLIADANNVGELAFTLQDFFRFSGGLSGLGSRTGSTISIGGDDLGIPMAQRNNARDLTTNLAALNLNFSPNAKWRHTGFAIGSTSKNELGSASLRTYLSSEINNQEFLTSTNRVENASGLMKYAVTYTPKEETYVKYSVFGKVADISTNSLLNSDFDQRNQLIGTIQERKPYSIQQKAEWYHAPSAKRVYSMEVNWEKKYIDPIYELTSNQQPFEGVFPVFDQERYQLMQNQEINTGVFEGALNYYQILNPTNHLNWSLGFNQTNQQMTSQVEFYEDLPLADLTAFQNDNRFGFRNLYLGMTWKTKWKSVVFSPSVFAHRYAWQDEQLGRELNQRKFLLLPNLYSKWALTTNRSLIYRFGSSVNFMDIQKLAQGLIIQDYNSIFRGNSLLENGLYYSHNLEYSHFDFFSAFNLSGGLNWIRKRNELVNSTNFQGINRLVSIQNIDPVNETLTGRINADKRFEKFKVSAGTNWNNFSTSTLLDDRINENKQFSHTYDFRITTTFLKKLEVDLKYEWNQNLYQSANIKNTFNMHSPSITIDLDIWKGLELNVDYAYNAYFNQQAGTKSEFEFLNAFLSYQGKSSPWEFRLTVWNILDTRSIRRDSFSENLISTYSYLVQPRYGLFAVKWDL